MCCAERHPCVTMCCAEPPFDQEALPPEEAESLRAQRAEHEAACRALRGEVKELTAHMKKLEVRGRKSVTSRCISPTFSLHILMFSEYANGALLCAWASLPYIPC